MKKYKAIFLDWDDTIGDWAGAARKALQTLYEQFHLNVIYNTCEDFIEAYEPYNLQLWGMYGRNEVTKERLQFERFYHPIEQLRVESQESRVRMAHEMGKTFLELTNKYFSVLPDTDRIVRLLAAKYPLTIISNGFKEVQHYKFEHSGLQDYFAYRIISEEVGINKPQPGIFQIALEWNKVQADEAIMIGDSYTSDIEGAKSAGIDQIWLHEGETNQTATYIVPHLADVLEIL